jgi:hypothetical protein
MFPLTNLSEAGDDLRSGRLYTAGLGLQVGPKTALRATASFSSSQYDGVTLNLGDPDFARAHYGLDLMFGAPSDAGLAPYVFFGGGPIFVDPAESGAESLTKPAGRVGAGVNYVPDNSFVVLFVEACGWVYQFDLFDFNRLQFDTAISGGLAFAFPF